MANLQPYAASVTVARGAMQPVHLAHSTAGGEGGDVYAFFLAGQSNMVGRGNGTALSGELLQMLLSLSSPDDQDAPIAFYAANMAGAASTSYRDSLCSMGSEHRYSTLDVRSRSFQPIERLPLTPVKSCDWERVIFRLDTHFGPEISLGLALHAQWPSKRIVLSKRAVSGSTLAESWVPGKPGYGALLTDLRRIAADHYPRRVVPAGLLWLQGEADSKDWRSASAYSTNLNSLVQHLRRDTGAFGLPIVIVGLPGDKGSREFQERVEAAFAGVASKLENVSYIDNPSQRKSPRHHLPIGIEGNVSRLDEEEFQETIRRLGSMNKLDPALTSDQRHALRNQACLHYSAAAHLRIGSRAARAFAWRHRRPPAPWPIEWDWTAPAPKATIYDWLEQQEASLLSRMPREEQMDGEHACSIVVDQPHPREPG